jgi:hypothetical protein
MGHGWHRWYLSILSFRLPLFSLVMPKTVVQRRSEAEPGPERTAAAGGKSGRLCP